MIYYAFNRGKGFIAWLIRFFSGYSITHTELVFVGYKLDDGERIPRYTGSLLNSVCFSADGRRNEVRFKNIKFTHLNRWRFMRLFDVDVRAAFDVACTLDGKRYGYGDVSLGEALEIDYNNPDRWYCSEVTGYVIGETQFAVSPGEQAIIAMSKGYGAWVDSESIPFLAVNHA